jgi:hypothetical protein
MSTAKLYLKYGAARHMSKGRPLESERPDRKIMGMIPEDGTPVALTELRKKATGEPYRMSASTLTKTLRGLVQSRRLERTVDASGERPRYQYKRTLPLPRGKIPFEDWFEPRIMMLRLAMIDTLGQILRHPYKDPDPSTSEEMFVAFLHGDLVDFQRLVRSHRIVNADAFLDKAEHRRQAVQALELAEKTERNRKPTRSVA